MNLYNEYLVNEENLVIDIVDAALAYEQIFFY